MKLKFGIAIVFLGLVGLLLVLFHYIVSQPRNLHTLTLLSEKDWQQLSEQPDVIYRGQVQYILRCYKCHGMEGQGNYIGPSLVDDEWVFGDTYSDIYRTIYYGAGNMKGIGKKMTLSDIQAITTYIKSL